jgi:hypothetical protein
MHSQLMTTSQQQARLSTAGPKYGSKPASSGTDQQLLTASSAVGDELCWLHHDLASYCGQIVMNYFCMHTQASRVMVPSPEWSWQWQQLGVVQGCLLTCALVARSLAGLLRNAVR